MPANPVSSKYRGGGTEVQTMKLKLQTLLLIGLIFAPHSALHGVDVRSRPNFVFILADDLGWADVAFHGGNVPTPHLDCLAKGGLELTQHYVAPVCSPTRTALLTGRCWSRFGITTPTNKLALPMDTVTLGDALKSKGYSTSLVGKWHLGSMPQWGPNHFGFDHTYGSLAGGISPWSHRYKKGPYSITWHRNEKFIDEPGHVTDLLTQEARKWIESRGSSPFFLYIAYTAVHLPIKEPNVWLRRVPESINGDVARHYAACIMHLDDAVGQIVAALEKVGVRHNTLLVFTSDNGGITVENNDLKYPDDKCPNGRLTGNNHPLRGGKGDVYEGGTRVPTIVSWPAAVMPGRVESPVQITDWMPTFCSLVGYQPDENLKWDGTDIRQLLINRLPLPTQPLYTVGASWRSASLRYGDWKLIVRGEDERRREELFNISTDPSESNNLADSNPKLLKSMLTRLQEVVGMDRDALVR